MKARASRVSATWLLGYSKSGLEEWGLGVQTLAWDVWASETTEQVCCHSDSWVLDGHETCYLLGYVTSSYPDSWVLKGNRIRGQDS